MEIFIGTVMLTTLNCLFPLSLFSFYKIIYKVGCGSKREKRTRHKPGSNQNFGMSQNIVMLDHWSWGLVFFLLLYSFFCNLTHLWAVRKNAGFTLIWNLLNTVYVTHWFHHRGHRLGKTFKLRNLCEGYNGIWVSFPVTFKSKWDLPDVWKKVMYFSWLQDERNLKDIESCLISKLPDLQEGKDKKRAGRHYWVGNIWVLHTAHLTEKLL